MTEEQVRETVIGELHGIAPEVDPREIDPRADLREQTDIDSMDFLNLVTGVGQALGVEVPEADYPKLRTLDGFVAYLLERTGDQGGGTPETR